MHLKKSGLHTKKAPRTVLLQNNQIEVERLFDASNELTIIHNEARYTLRLTKNGKLILTK